MERKSLRVKIGNSILGMCVVTLLFACELLFLPEHLRENKYDENAQISNFYAVQQNVDMVRVGFGLRDSHDVGGDEMVDEVRLVYKLDGPPISVNQILPEEAGGSKTFSREDGTYAYFWDLNRFSSGDEVWFALYPRVNHSWRAPLYRRINVQSSLIPSQAGTFQLQYGLQVDAISPDLYVEEVEINVSYQAGTTEKYGIFNFDLPDNVLCSQAFIEDIDTATTTSGTDNVIIYPMSRRHIEWDDIGAIEKLADTSVGGDTGFTFGDLTTAGTVDITDVVNRAILLGTDSFLVGASADTVNSLQPSTVQITMNYIE